VFNFKYEEIWSNHKKHTISATDQLKLRSKIRQNSISKIIMLINCFLCTWQWLQNIS